MIFVDNSPYMSDNPTRVGDRRLHVAEGLTPESVFQLALSWANDADGSFSRNFLRQQMTANVSDEVFEKALEQHLLLPRKHAADLFVNVFGLDLRDIVPRVTVPSLYVGGKTSLVDWNSVVLQAEQAAQGTYEIFEEDEGGAHFMFLENPVKFNRIVREFLG